MTFSISSIFYKHKFRRYYSNLEGLKNLPGAYVISVCKYDADSSAEICTVIDRGWTEDLKNDVDKVLQENEWPIKFQTDLTIMAGEISREEWEKIESNIIPKQQ